MTAPETPDRSTAAPATPLPLTPPEPLIASRRAGLWRAALAGLAVAGVLLPEAVAYAAIAGVPPQHALLAALVGLTVYPLLGSSRFAIVAPTSSAAAIFASSVAQGGVDTGFALVIVTGALFLLAAALRADFLGSFISRPVLRGFVWALAVTISIKQLPHVLGLQVQAQGVLGLLHGLWQQRAAVHLPSLVAAGAALALWLGLRHALPVRLGLPRSLIVLALGVAAALWWPQALHGVAQVGPIEARGLHLAWPALDDAAWLQAVQVAPALLLILFAESWGAVRSLALAHGDMVSTRRELLALGGSNLLSGVLQGLPVGAGFSAASANEASGGRSKAAGVAAAAALALLLWQARGALALLPLPVLAAVVIAILSHNLWPHSVIASLRLGSDAWLAVAAAAGVLALGVLSGMLLAVGLSLLLALRRFAEPRLSELGRLPDSHDYIDVQRHAGLQTPPAGLLVLRPEEPLFFANAEKMLGQARQRAHARGARVVVLSMEMCDDFDSTTVETLGEFAEALAQDGALLLLARLKDRPRLTLERAGLGHIGSNPASPGRLFWSVDDAVQVALPVLGPASPR